MFKSSTNNSKTVSQSQYSSSFNLDDLYGFQSIDEQISDAKKEIDFLIAKIDGYSRGALSAPASPKKNSKNHDSKSSISVSDLNSTFS